MAISLISYFVSRRRNRRTGRRQRRIQLSPEAEVVKDSSKKSVFLVACNRKLGRYCYKFNPLSQIDITRRRKRKSKKRCCCCCTNHDHQRHHLFNRRGLEPLADGCGFRIDESSAYVAVGSIIYCIGGYRGRSMSRIDTILCFDTTCPKSGWKIGPPMIKSRAHPQAAAIDGKLYVFGGLGDDDDDDDMEYESKDENGDDCKPWGEVFDPSRDKWEALPEPPIRLEDTISAVVVLDQQQQQQGTKTLLLMVSKCGKLYGYNVSTTSWDLLFIDQSLSFSSLKRLKVFGPAVVLDKTLYWYTERNGKHHKIEAYDLEESMWFTGIVDGLEWDGLVTPPLDHEHVRYPSLLHLQHNNMWCLVWEDQRAYKDSSSGSTYRCIDSIKFKVNKRVNSSRGGYGELDIQIQSSQIHLIHPSLCFKNAFFI